MFGCGRFTRNYCFFWLSLVVRKLVVGYLKDTNAGEWIVAFSEKMG